MLGFISKYRNYLIDDKPLERTNKDGTVFEEEHYVFAFDNGRGASIIRSPYTYGGPDNFELAVLRDPKSGENHIDYETPITDDVLGDLTDEEVTSTLTKIKDLPLI